MNRSTHVLRAASSRANRLITAYWGSSIPMFPVVGYPKSGGTWVCKVIAHIMDLPFAQVPLLPVAMPCVLHGHWRYHPRLRGATCTIRDGRDIMVSYFHYCRLQYAHGPAPPVRALIEKVYGDNLDAGSITEMLPRFIEYVSKNPIGTRLTWPQYCEEWVGKPGVEFVRYERMASEPAGEIHALCQRHGWTVDPDRIVDAVDANSMLNTTGRRPGQEDQSAIVRKGIVGDWRTVFNDEACQIFAHYAGQTLVHLGYEAEASWQAWNRQPAVATSG